MLRQPPLHLGLGTGQQPMRQHGDRELLEVVGEDVIPVVEGGSNEAENIEVLCGPCNRKKGATLTVG